MPSALDILKEYWGYSSFRPVQEDIIRSVLAGKDVLALLPTGGGKSICFQVPALAMPGLCLVVSPLIALMKDQVENLRRKGITAFAIYSGMSRREVLNILQLAGRSNCRFLYVSPERLETRLFREYLPGLGIRLLAIDEAHCISQWGYDFRPPYLRIASLREELPDVPVLALTASATPEVQEDICLRLGFRERLIYQASFERPNLSYSVFHTDSAINRIAEILSKLAGSSIVYCRSRKRTQEIARQLNSRGIGADYYHAGLPQDERSRRQDDWIHNRRRVMVCTNAFGMGIDKPDVRCVIHADVPECLEYYYQEAGRAGRDGKRSYAVLLYNDPSLEDLRKLPEQRYPPVEKIREVYRSLMNYLQVPAGAGEEKYFDFDLPDFLKKFGLEASLVLASLKALEQEGMLSFNEQVFLPAHCRFICNKETLYRFEQERPELEPMLKALLRSYEGIFDYPVSIHEKSLARLAGLEAAQCISQLKALQAGGIIEYEPVKDKPQVYFLQGRPSANDLNIRESYYRQRKQVFSKRLETMLDYIRDSKDCRSRLIADYFGASNAADCGICDNCLRKKRPSLNAEDMEIISRRILQILEKSARPVNEILTELGTISQEKAWQVIDYLQAENIIRTNEDGRLFIQ